MVKRKKEKRKLARTIKKKPKKFKTKVKKKIIKKRIPTLIPNFDNLIGGGFKKNSVNLVAGGPGCGKTIFAIQYLINGIKKYKEPAIYVTFEEKKEKLYNDMLSFGWDLAKYEKQRMFNFLEYTPEQVKKVLMEGGGLIETVISETKSKRVVIDSITSFSLLYKDELSKKEAALALFELIDKWDCTALLTSQDESSDGKSISAALEFEVDGIILIYNIRKKGVRQRGIEVLKMRGTKHPTKTMELIIGKKGIEINPKKIVKF